MRIKYFNVKTDEQSDCRLTLSVADPGLPRGGGAKISQKLHEIKRIWSGGRPKFYYVDPPLVMLQTLNASASHGPHIRKHMSSTNNSVRLCYRTLQILKPCSRVTFLSTSKFNNCITIHTIPNFDVDTNTNITLTFRRTSANTGNLQQANNSARCCRIFKAFLPSFQSVGFGTKKVATKTMIHKLQSTVS